MAARPSHSRSGGPHYHLPSRRHTGIAPTHAPAPASADKGIPHPCQGASTLRVRRWLWVFGRGWRGTARPGPGQDAAQRLAGRGDPPPQRMRCPAQLGEHLLRQVTRGLRQAARRPRGLPQSRARASRRGSRVEYERALALASQVADRRQEARAHDGLVRSYLGSGDLGRARDDWSAPWSATPRWAFPRPIRSGPRGPANLANIARCGDGVR